MSFLVIKVPLGLDDADNPAADQAGLALMNRVLPA